MKTYKIISSIIIIILIIIIANTSLNNYFYTSYFDETVHLMDINVSDAKLLKKYEDYAKDTSLDYKKYDISNIDITEFINDRLWIKGIDNEILNKKIALFLFDMEHTLYEKDRLSETDLSNLKDLSKSYVFFYDKLNKTFDVVETEIRKERYRLVVITPDQKTLYSISYGVSY